MCIALNPFKQPLKYLRIPRNAMPLRLEPDNWPQVSCAKHYLKTAFPAITIKGPEHAALT
jgi:hypothetical protein